MRGVALRSALALSLVGLAGRVAASEGGPAPAVRASNRPVEAGDVLTGASRCPEPASVWAALGTLLPAERLAARLAAVAGTMPRIELVDAGASFRVIAAGRVREYRDERRDCADRARIAAVVVALAIDPAAPAASPVATAPEPPPPAAAPPPTSPVLTETAPVAAPGLRPARLYLGPNGDVGWGTGAVMGEGGVSLRLVVGRGRVALSAGAAAIWPVETEVGGVLVRHRRLPIDLAVRAQIPGRRLHAFGELGLAAAVFSLSGVELAAARSGSAFELGARGSLGVELATAGRIAPFAAVQATVVPSPPELFARPQGSLGRTPFLWIGATIGASVGFP